MQLIVDNIAKSFGIHEVFKNISFMLDKGEKVGLVGANGGKSTLLKCLLGIMEIDEGKISLAPGLYIGYAEQGFALLSDKTLWEFMLANGADILAMRAKLQELQQEIALTPAGAKMEKLLADYARLLSHYEFADGYHYETRIKTVLTGLNFTQADWEKQAEEFSGGQKTRILLAGALVKNPELLLLDEPTNHLDVAMTEWLEDYLRSYRGTLLMVSHDRWFLNNVATRILALSGGQLRSYKGNYDRYLEQRAVEVKTEQAAYDSQQEYIEKTEAYIRRFKAGIKSKMARGRQSQLNRLEKPLGEEGFSLHLPPAAESAEKNLILSKLAVGYNGKPVLSNLNLNIKRGEKVALLGCNGSGKSTLLKTICGELEALAGTVKVGNRVKIGYFAQTYEMFAPEQSLLDWFLQNYGYSTEETRSLLGGMLFHGDAVFQPIGSLSGGQKARLVLLKLVLDGANFLLMDEPTNHLDIPAREIVEAALAAFDGTILLVSHDRYFVSEVANRIWEIEEAGIYSYEGDYAFYCEEKLKKKNAEYLLADKKKDLGKPKAAVKTRSETRKSNPAEVGKRLARLETAIREQEGLLKFAERKLANPANHQTLEQSESVAVEYTALKAKVEQLLQEWEILMEQLEEGNS